MRRITFVHESQSKAMSKAKLHIQPTLAIRPCRCRSSSPPTPRKASCLLAYSVGQVNTTTLSSRTNRALIKTLNKQATSNKKTPSILTDTEYTRTNLLSLPASPVTQDEVGAKTVQLSRVITKTTLKGFTTKSRSARRNYCSLFADRGLHLNVPLPRARYQQYSEC